MSATTSDPATATGGVPSPYRCQEKKADQLGTLISTASIATAMGGRTLWVERIVVSGDAAQGDTRITSTLRASRQAIDARIQLVTS